MPDIRPRKLTRLRLAIRPAWSTRFRRLVFAAFVLCLLNLAWSAVGTWEINLGGERQSYPADRSRVSGAVSESGFLTIAVRQSLIMTYIGPLSDSALLTPIREPTPWAIRAYFQIGPSPFGLNSINSIRTIPRRSSTPVPGLLIHWDRNPPDEWYNRGIAIHWGWLTLLTAILPIWWIVRATRIVPEGFCHACGYDLRATPARCPECGTVPDAAKA